MSKSELAAKMASDLDAFMNRGNQVKTLKPETAQDIADKRAQKRWSDNQIRDRENQVGAYSSYYGEM